MPRLFNLSASTSVLAVLAVASLGLGGCATEKYVDEHIAVVNGRIDGVDAKATDAIRRADAAQATASAAQADAQQANQRLDQLTGRVDTMEQRAMQQKKPRN